VSETVDVLGPVDRIVIEFPGSKFKSEIGGRARRSSPGRVIRVLDLLVLKKDDDGSLEAFELSDLDVSELNELRS
jgi:hypothetical protein